MLIMVRPERVDDALALARTLAIPQPQAQPATRPAGGGLVFIAFPPLTEEQADVVVRSGLVQMSAKTGFVG